MRIKFGLLTTLCCLTCLGSPVIAEESENLPDKFRIAIGGYLINNFDSKLSLTEPNLGAGISIDPGDTLGLTSDQSVFRLDGYYRFNRKHALTYSWYSISSEGNRVLDEEFEWVDDEGNVITIPVGAQVKSVLDYDIFKVGYLWSFHHTDKVELAVGGGFHITRIGVELDSSLTNPPSRKTQDVRTTLPLPVISLVLVYNVTPKFSWHLKTEAFAITFDDWEGNYTDTTLGMEYRAWKNVGIGAGLGSNSLKITETTSEYKFQYDNRINGVNLFVSAYF